jgi:LacI family transcriptional regulator
MPVTMLDIAKGLNVSVVTVSKVLRNQGKINVATRRRVLRRAKELNYPTNWIARSLVTRRTFTIGLLLPDFTHPFFAEIAKAVAETSGPTAITSSFRISKKTRNSNETRRAH